MKLPRRKMLRLAVAVTASAALPLSVRADSYPARPVRIMVGSTPGASPDIIARMIGQALSERLGQAFVVENRNGASGNLAAEMVVRAPPDGYTLLLVSASNAINPWLYDNLSFDIVRDIAPIASVVRFPNVITVRPPFTAKTLPEFIADAKARPGKITIGTPPIGSAQHVAGELFKMMTDTNVAIIPYRGGPPAITDALSGTVDGVIGTVLLVNEYVKAGKLRALAVTGDTRSELLPDVPAVSEFVPGFENSQWIGLGAPKHTPAEIVGRLNGAINASLADPGLRARMVGLGGTVITTSPDEFGKFIADETAKWGKVIKFGGIKAE